MGFTPRSPQLYLDSQESGSIGTVLQEPRYTPLDPPAQAGASDGDNPPWRGDIYQASTVFIVDDNDTERGLLSAYLTVKQMNVKGFPSAEALLSTLTIDQPGCLVLDYRMPGMSGIELQQKLLARGFRIPVVFVTGAGSVPVSVQALKAGALAFLEKPIDYEELLAVVRQAIVEDARQRRDAAEQATLRQRWTRLTPREAEVTRRMIAGQNSKVIAKELGISYRTVEGYRSKIYLKMQAQCFAQLLNMARFSDFALDGGPPGLQR